MVLLRRVIGDALRARRQGQHRTLREVSTAANVSLGYLSEIERGQKEASSELLAAICDALGAQLSDVLRQVSDTLAMAEQVEDALVPVGAGAETTGTDTGARADQRADQAAPADAVRRSRPVSAPAEPARAEQAPAERVPTDRVPAVQRAALGMAGGRRMADGRAVRLARPAEPVRRIGGDGEVTVSVRQDSPLRATLKATRSRRGEDRDRERDVVYA
jgi:XRE family transcriptional regulator, stress-response regulator